VTANSVPIIPTAHRTYVLDTQQYPLAPSKNDGFFDAVRGTKTIFIVCTCIKTVLMCEKFLNHMTKLMLHVPVRSLLLLCVPVTDAVTDEAMSMSILNLYSALS